jgi:hypothetical protein
MTKTTETDLYNEALAAADRLRAFIQDRYATKSVTRKSAAELRDLIRAVDALLAVLPDDQQQ